MCPRVREVKSGCVKVTCLRRRLRRVSAADPPVNAVCNFYSTICVIASRGCNDFYGGFAVFLRKYVFFCGRSRSHPGPSPVLPVVVWPLEVTFINLIVVHCQDRCVDGQPVWLLGKNYQQLKVFVAVPVMFRLLVRFVFDGLEMTLCKFE